MGIAVLNAFSIRLPAKKSIYLLRALATLATPNLIKIKNSYQHFKIIQFVVKLFAYHVF
jgi:hypothetical protein